MTADGRGVSNGPNGRALDATLAETGPGLSDEAVLDGELAPGELDQGADDALRKLRESGWTPKGEDTVGSSQPADKG